jgi:hypothetical protein
VKWNYLDFFNVNVAFSFPFEKTPQHELYFIECALVVWNLFLYSKPITNCGITLLKQLLVGWLVVTVVLDVVGVGSANVELNGSVDPGSSD